MNERMNFSTGPQIRPANANRLLVLIQNTNSTRTTVTVRLRDLENPNNTSTRQVTIDANSTTTVTFANIPSIFEVTLSNIPAGVYFTATIVRGRANALNIVENFLYNDFIQTSTTMTDTLD